MTQNNQEKRKKKKCGNCSKWLNLFVNPCPLIEERPSLEHQSCDAFTSLKRGEYYKYVILGGIEGDTYFLRKRKPSPRRRKKL